MTLVTAGAPLTLDNYNHNKFSSAANIPVYQPFWSKDSSDTVQWLIVTQNTGTYGWINFFPSKSQTTQREHIIKHIN